MLRTIVPSISKRYETTFQLITRIRCNAIELRQSAEQTRLLIEESHDMLTRDPFPRRSFSDPLF